MTNKIINIIEKNDSKEVNYSELIKEFIKPIEDKFPKSYDINDLFFLANHAWNLGNISLLIPKKEFNSILMDFPLEDNLLIGFLNELIEIKRKKYKEYTRFVTGITVKEEKNTLVLKADTVSEDQYSEMINEETSSDNDNPYNELGYIDRRAVIMMPKKPFYKWMDKVHPLDAPMRKVKESRVFLVKNESPDFEAYIKLNYTLFFDMFLEEWHADKKDWPQKRTYKMFQNWVTINYSTLIFDLEKTPITKKL